MNIEMIGHPENTGMDFVFDGTWFSEETTCAKNGQS